MSTARPPEGAHFLSDGQGQGPNGAPATLSQVSEPVALFPLRTVLFPGGRLPLKVFEARYLDLVSSCMREQQPFGVVCLLQGGEVRKPGGAAVTTRFEPMGVLAHLVEVDAMSPSVLKVRCAGGARFQWTTLQENRDGLWQASGVALLPNDPPLPPGERFADAVQALQRAYAALAQRPEADRSSARSIRSAISSASEPFAWHWTPSCRAPSGC